MYFYKRTEPGLFTVGFEDAKGAWHPDSDHANRDEAAMRTAELNGASKKKDEIQHELFASELIRAQKDAIQVITNDLLDARETCCYLNNIYRAAWPLMGEVCAEGEVELHAEHPLFVALANAMETYDQNRDLRGRFDPIERVETE